MTDDAPRGDYERARRPGEREQRRQHIVTAVRSEITAGRPGNELTISMIARAAGLSPAGIYTYYRGRESILLDVLVHDLEQWLGDAAARLDSADAPSVDAVAGMIVDRLATVPTLAPLLTELTNGIEAAADPGDLAAFKARAAARVDTTARALERALPGLDGHAALRYVRALVIGLWAYGTPHAGQATGSTLDLTRAWFDEELRRSLTAVLRGLLSG